jgi:predicted ABC-type ATPase
MMGSQYFNPDEAAVALRKEFGYSVEEANARAWQEGKQRLEAAIRDREDFAFETTLGANTIPRLLAEAAGAGLDVVIWFVGLSSPEQHIARVRERVAAGGHGIPEEKIRQRWDGSRQNLIELMPHLAELRVFDNSADVDPTTDTIPTPKLLLDWQPGKVIAPNSLEQTPEWAKPIVERALQLQRGAG